MIFTWFKECLILSKSSICCYNHCWKRNGVVGIGRVSGKLVRPTITKALDRAKLNIIEIRRGSGSWECSTAVPNSLPFEVSGRTGSTRVTIKPAPPGVGLVTNQVGQIMLKLAGVEDAWSFT